MIEIFTSKYASVLVLATIGGLAKYAVRIKRGQKFSWKVLMIDLFISAFAGLLLTSIGVSFNILSLDKDTAIFWSAISGYGGIKFIDILEDFAVNKTKKTLNKDDSNE